MLGRHTAHPPPADVYARPLTLWAHIVRVLPGLGPSCAPSTIPGQISLCGRLDQTRLLSQWECACPRSNSMYVCVAGGWRAAAASSSLGVAVSCGRAGVVDSGAKRSTREEGPHRLGSSHRHRVVVTPLSARHKAHRQTAWDLRDSRAEQRSGTISHWLVRTLLSRHVLGML